MLHLKDDRQTVTIGIWLVECRYSSIMDRLPKKYRMNYYTNNVARKPNCRQVERVGKLEWAKRHQRVVDPSIE